MSTEPLKKRIAELLTATGKRHHQAFAASDGEDPEWPIWYAEQLQEPLSRLLGVELTRSRLVYCLLRVEDERAARMPQRAWAEAYAEQFADCFGPSAEPAVDRLALYHFESCPFCARVRAAIERLGIDVELRDIRREPRHWDDLVRARGRATVPVLRITSPDGSERWMPESRDIVRYLDQTYG